MLHSTMATFDPAVSAHFLKCRLHDWQMKMVTYNLCPLLTLHAKTHCMIPGLPAEFGVNMCQLSPHQIARRYKS